MKYIDLNIGNWPFQQEDVLNMVYLVGVRNISIGAVPSRDQIEVFLNSFKFHK